MPDIDLATARQCVLAAIERVEYAEQRWREKNLEPGASSAERQRALAVKQTWETEFGWQWRNVKALLAEKETG